MLLKNMEEMEKGKIIHEMELIEDEKTKMVK